MSKQWFDVDKTGLSKQAEEHPRRAASRTWSGRLRS